MGLYRFSSFVAALTFVLLLMGGVVHNTRSSLACPDWPLCYGQLMPKMVGNVLIEHSHRLVATSVGICTIVLLALLALKSRRSHDRSLTRLGIWALFLVCLQGILGGITVIYHLPTWVSSSHLATSMVFFLTLIYIAFRTRPIVTKPRLPLAKSAQMAALVGTLTVYVQMILGAVMRHAGAGLACVELPLCRGTLFPSAGNAYLVLHMLHRMLGLVVLATVVVVSTMVFRSAHGLRHMRLLAALAPVLVLCQLVLGWLSISSFLDVIPVTAHLGVAALLLADLFSLYLLSRGDLATHNTTAATAALPVESAA